MDVTTGNNVDRGSSQYETRVNIFKSELTRQPYAGVYLFYMMFEAFSDDFEVAE